MAYSAALADSDPEPSDGLEVPDAPTALDAAAMFAELVEEGGISLTYPVSVNVYRDGSLWGAYVVDRVQRWVYSAENAE